jgi:type I site-specific restriction-modification system R (restriction) subunit
VPVFEKVIVITDRVVLDRQLRDTIYQFDHVAGVVKKIDEDSAQLAEALSRSTARSSPRAAKFPFVLDKVAKLGDRRYAVIIDEAHSSQSGESANALKKRSAGSAPTTSTRTATCSPPPRWPGAGMPACRLRLHRHTQSQDTGAVRLVR